MGASFYNAFVQWGLAQRQLEGVESLGVDEIHWGRGLQADNFLTVIYQIDAHCRRLLWVGRRRSKATLRRGLKALGPEVVQGLRFVCSDLWKPYLQVLAAEAEQALHVLDRFHIVMHLNQAVDQVRRAESTRLRAQGKQAAQGLKHMRWPLLRRGSRVRGRARQKLNALLASKLATARAWELKEAFQHFWHYKSVVWAGAFLDYWCYRAMRSRLEPMRQVARMLRTHEELLLNWFRAKGEISNGAVEGLNNKIRVVTRRAYGFQSPWCCPRAQRDLLRCCQSPWCPTGIEALQVNTMGWQNTATGAVALGSNTAGNQNTASGFQAGETLDRSFMTGSNDTFLGANSWASTGTLNNATAIGANALVGENNAMVLGSINGVNGAAANTLVGIGTTWIRRECCSVPSKMAENPAFSPKCLHQSFDFPKS